MKSRMHIEATYTTPMLIAIGKLQFRDNTTEVRSVSAETAMSQKQSASNTSDLVPLVIEEGVSPSVID